MRKQSRMEDLPTLSMLMPTASGMYALPLLESLSICTTLDCEGSIVKSPWRFISLFLDHDFHLLEFTHEECPVSQDGTTSLHQTRYLYGGFVHRVNLRLSEISSRVYCILFCLQKIGHEVNATSEAESTTKKELRARIQIENGESLQALGIMDMFPESSCRWFSLAALYRSKKLYHWKLQALGGSSQANSIHAGLDEMHELLVSHAIIQIYEIVVSYHSSAGDGEEGSEFEEYAKRFSKNIRFGRNGRISLNPIARSGNNQVLGRCGSFGMSLPLVISLKLQGLENDVEVYRHESSHRSLPTTQSVYRNILRLLGEHGIKESLQQNPFIGQEKKSKRQVEIRVINEQTSLPVERAHVFVKKNLDNIKLTANLAKKIVPTLIMGSRLVSIRRRLQMRRVLDDTKAVAAAFVDEMISVGMKVALFSLRRESKLIPYIRSRAMLKKVMRQRYEISKERILEQVKESERSRIYSRNGPIRLQHVYQTPLEFSSSERDLLDNFSAFGVEVFKEDELLVSSGHDTTEDARSVYEIWRTQRNADGEEEKDPSIAEEPAPTTELDDKKSESSLRPQSAGKARPGANDAIQDSLERARERKFCYVSDAEGKITCRLTPGSYSLYIFHLEYFEWTSMVVIFPISNSSGSQGGTGISCLTAQEIFVPLEAYRWTYKIQLVDFYHQHSLKMVADIPIQVIDKCTSQRYIVKTDAKGCATWEVGKGLYSVSALKECTCILYSASKNVVVDGGRHRPAKTIFIPVLIGKLTIEFAVASAVPIDSITGCPGLAKIHFEKDDPEPLDQGGDGASVFSDSQADPVGRADQTFAIGSSSKIPIRLGRYDVDISADNFFTTRLSLHVGWNTYKSNARHLAVLCPAITQRDVYRVIFSYVNALKSMDAMIEVFKDEVSQQT